MGCRTAGAGSIAPPSRRDSIQPLVLLAIAHDELRARFAYQLAASGFTVVTDLATRLDASRPDVIVAELDGARPDVTSSVASIRGDERLRGVPVIAVADDVGVVTQTAARQGGCAAVCLTECSAEALASGIHAVLDGRER